MRSLLLLRASELVLRNERVTATALRPLSHASWRGTIRKRVSRRGIVRRRDEQSCASLPAYFKLRDRLMAKAAVLRLAVQMVSKVSFAAIVRLPSAFLHITRHPALAACVRSRGDKANRCEFDSSGSAELPSHEGLHAQSGLPMHKPRHGSTSRAASRLMVLCGRRAAWSGSWPP